MAHAAPAARCGRWPDQVAIQIPGTGLRHGCAIHAAHLLADAPDNAWVSGPDGSGSVVARLAHRIAEKRTATRTAARRRTP